MGIFFDHGIVYMIKSDKLSSNLTKKINGDDYIVIISTKDTDKMLVETNFYKENLTTWLDPRPSFVKKISLPEDFIISEEWKAKINMFENIYNTKGDWYEVFLISTTY